MNTNRHPDPLTDAQFADLLQAKETTDHFFAQAMNLHLVADLDGTILRVNPGWETTLGHPPARLVGSRFLDLVHPDDLAPTLAEMGKLATGQTTLRFENRYRHHDGSYRWLAWSAEANPQSRLVFAVASDITEHKAVAAELEQSRRRVEHTNKILLALRNINQLITRETNRETLLRRTCGIMVESQGIFNAWIALVDESGRFEQPYAAGFGETEFEPMLERLRSGNLPTCVRKALQSEGTIVVRDPVAECPDCPFSACYSARAGMAWRLAAAGRTYGVLVVSAPAEYAADTEEQELFAELSLDISFALQKLDTDHLNRQLTYLVDNIQHPMALLSRDALHLAANQAYGEFYGTPTNKIIGQSAADFLGRKPFDRLFRTHFEHALTGEPVRYEIQVGRPGGARWMQMEYTPLRGDDGTVHAIAAQGTDITERVRHAQRLEELNRELDQARRAALNIMEDAVEARRRLELTQFAVDHSADPIFWVRDDGSFAYVNDSACRQLGYAKDELSGMSVLDIDPGLSADRWTEHWQGLRARGAAVIESSHRRKDGSIYPVEVHADHVEFGGHEYSFAYVHDISARKQAQQEIRNLTHIQSLILDNSTLGIALVRHRVFEWANPRLCEMLSLPMDVLCGTSTRLLYPEEEAFDFIGKEAYAQLGRGQRFDHDIQLQRRNKPPFWCRLIGTALDPGHPDDGSIWMFEDIDDKRAREEELQQTGKMEAVGQLAGGIAHDFNNILQGIMGFGEILKMGMEPETVAHANICEILKAARRAAELTRQLLAFSRKQPVQMEELDLAEVVRDSMALLNILMGEKHEIEVNLEDGLPPVRADYGQITQVIMNLALNARDAMPNCGRLMIGAFLCAQGDAALHPNHLPGPRVCLSIADTGIGMDETVKQRLFEPFFTTKEVGRGTGLGLAVVYGIVKQSHGTINVESAPGKGSRFCLCFPAVARP